MSPAVARAIEGVVQLTVRWAEQAGNGGCLGLTGPAYDSVVAEDKDGPGYGAEHQAEDEPFDPSLQRLNWGSREKTDPGMCGLQAGSDELSERAKNEQDASASMAPRLMCRG
jgi:hypothetical protein